MLSFMSCVNDHLYIFFGEISIQIFCPFLNYFFLLILRVLDIFHTLIPYKIRDLKVFLPFSGYLFTFLMMSFNVRKVLILMKSNLLFYCFVTSAFDVISKKSLLNPMS